MIELDEDQIQISLDNEEKVDDKFIKDLLDDYSGYSSSSLSTTDQIKFEKASTEVANQLMRMHGIKPFDRKKWVSNRFSGRGMLSITDILMESVMNGRMTLMEKRKKQINPDKPSVAMMMDVSSSMKNGKTYRSAILIGAALCEFFRGNFAKDFAYATIGSGNAHFTNQMTLQAMKRQIIETSFHEGSTMFSPAINEFETHNWFDNRTTKYMFIITDGFPEINEQVESNVYQENISATANELEKFIFYMRERWAKDDRLEYFWIQLGNERSFLEYLTSYWIEYLPPKEEALIKFSESEYNDAVTNGKNDPNSVRYKWGEFLWSQFKVGNIFYTTNGELASGKGFHKMVDYFLYKFKKRIK